MSSSSIWELKFLWNSDGIYDTLELSLTSVFKIEDKSLFISDISVICSFK